MGLNIKGEFHNCLLYTSIIGHSERRNYFGETDETVNKKLHKAFAEGINPIMCVGESLSERDCGKAFDVVKRQLVTGLAGLTEEQAAKLVVAYEPIWACLLYTSCRSR